MSTALAPRAAAPAPLSLSARVRDALPRGRQLSDEAWQGRHRFLRTVLWALWPVLAVVGLARGYSVPHTLVESSPVLMFAAAGTYAPGRRYPAILVCIGLLTFDAVLVHFTGGLIEAHFTFFILVPLVALYQDIVAFFVAIGFVALQHTAMSLLDPESVFNHAAAQHKPLLWAGVHAGFVIVLVAVILVFWRFAEQTQIELDAVVEEAREHARRAEAEAVAAQATATRLAEVMDELRHSAELAEREASTTQEAAARRQAMLDRAAGFEADVQRVVVGVATTASHMEDSARALGSLAGTATEQAARVTGASEAVASNVASVATATGQLSACIDEISRQVAHSAAIASRAVEDVEHTNVTVDGLSEAVGQIGPVVQLISGIASQTKLLALNATIEAARAGEAGKGFAVVAGQVQELAGQTAKATEEIGQQIATIQAATHQAVGAIQQIGSTIAQVNDIAATITTSVREQTAATQEIAESAAKAADGTRTVSAGIGDVTRSAADSSRATVGVTQAASELSQEAEELRSQLERFLAAVRAA